jgi:hypothetical protein
VTPTDINSSYNSVKDVPYMSGRNGENRSEYVLLKWHAQGARENAYQYVQKI